MVEESHHESREATCMNEATTLARVIVRQIVQAGITDAVLAPGSRNAPLSIAFHQAEQAGLIRLHVKIDERGAAFFALGLTKATGRPVPVICTSGTAVANFHPAVLEASHSNAPLLLLTADRPARLRRTGANNDATYQQRRIMEGDPSQPGDLNHPDMVKLRTNDVAKLATWMQDQGLDLTFFIDVWQGRQDPWIKMRANDTNNQVDATSSRVNTG